MSGTDNRIARYGVFRVSRSNHWLKREMESNVSRRVFLGSGAAAAAGILLPGAAGPARPYPISLAAYSMRKYLTLKNPTMTLEGFIRKCHEWDVDGTELTQYFFAQPVTPAYIMKLKRPG